MTSYKVASISQIKNGQSKPFTVNGKPILVFNVAGDFFAVINICTHEHFSMEDGPLDGDVLTCPHHAAQYDVRTGKVLSPPAPAPLQTFKTKVVGSDLFIEM